MLAKINYCLLLLVIANIADYRAIQTASTPKQEVGMFKITVLYPNGDDKTFDMEYYEKKHMPMVAGLLGSNLKLYEIDKGISGRTSSDKVPFLAIGYFYVSDVAEYNKAIAQNRDAVLSDIKHYTNIQPVLQISEIKQLVYSKK